MKFTKKDKAANWDKRENYFAKFWEDMKKKKVVCFTPRALVELLKHEGSTPEGY